MNWFDLFKIIAIVLAVDLFNLDLVGIAVAGSINYSFFWLFVPL